MTEPRDWEDVRLRTLLTQRSVRNRADLPLLSVVRQRGVILRDVTSRDSNHNFIPTDLSNYKVVRRGDLAINKMKAWSGSLGVSDYDGIVSPAYYVFETHFGDPRFAHYLLRSRAMADEFARASVGVRVGQWDLSIPAMKAISVRVPGTEEQKLIVRYLDHAELNIARAMEGRRAMAQLLRERRRAILEDHLLRGASDPSAGPLAESGVPWLGEVPSNWNLTPFRGIFRPTRKLVGRRSDDFTLLSLTLNGVIVRDLTNLKGKFPANFDTYQEVHSGELVMCLFDVDETPRTVGISHHEGMITGAYDLFRASDAVVARFAELQLLTLDQGKKFKPLYRGLRKVIPRSALAGARLCVPPSERIEGILDSVNEATAATDRALLAIDQEVALLGEFRTRLISDVVTGKKDIRAEAAGMKDVDGEELAAVLAGGTIDVDDCIEGEIDAD